MTSPADGQYSVSPLLLPQAQSEAGSATRFDAERNSAFTIGVLHIFVVFAAPALLWNSAVIHRPSLVLWTIAEALLALVSFFAYYSVTLGKIDRFVLVSQTESVGTAITFGGLAWLGPTIASATPSKHVLMIALIAVTSISAANSSHITRRRPMFGRLIVIVALSYTIAFALKAEWVFATLTVLWCLSITVLTRVGYHGMVELLELRQASEKTARHDDLTGLLSRSAFFEVLNERASADTEPGTLVLFDLDGFKAVNDSFGHAAGDAVLSATAKRLEVFLPEGAGIGRLGGDEFAAVFASDEIPIDSTIEATLQAVGEPIRVEGRELYVAASAGWTRVTAGAQAADLLAQADAAMYQSKNSETDANTGFDVELREQLDRSLDLRQRFRTALKRQEIEFWAQPLIRTSDGNPVAVELLARWPQEDDSFVGPLEFTRVADETGLAVELDRQALTAAQSLLAAWRADPLLSSVMVKANVSAVHLHDDDLIRTVRDLIPVEQRKMLGLEFVESRLITVGARLHAQLQNLIDMGITLSIDDFGVGYSSLAYLRSLPISEIKIDRSFVTQMDTDAINQGLVRAIVDIASTLGLPTVAEGIETQGELEAAARLGVTVAQGFYVGHPLPLSETEAALRSLRESAASIH